MVGFGLVILITDANKGEPIGLKQHAVLGAFLFSCRSINGELWAHCQSNGRAINESNYVDPGRLATDSSVNGGAGRRDYADNPDSLGAANTPGGARDVEVLGGYAYVADGQAGLQVIDVTDPSNPTIVGGVDTGFASGVAVSGNFAFVADYSSGLQVLDITSPATPTVVGGVSMPDVAYNVAISGNYAYVADYFSGLQVVDITNPVSPAIVGSASAGAAYGVAVSGNHAYIASSYGLEVIDITSPADAVRVGGANTYYSAEDVAVSGNYAYVVDGAGLLIYEITNPANPVLVGSLDTPIFAFSVAIAGDYAYIADSNSGLQVIDIRNPANPSIVGSADTPGEASGVAVSGGYTYVTTFESGLVILPVQCVEASGAQAGNPPTVFHLFNAYPNPFNPSTTISFSLPQPTTASLHIYDLSGRLVRTLLEDEVVEIGRHEAVWRGLDDTGRRVPSGVYLYRLGAGDYRETKRMILIK